MRLSAVPTDPGYDPLAYRCKVMLNGEPVDAVTADEEESMVVHYVPDPAGGIMMDGDVPRLVVSYGKVSILFLDRALALPET